MSVEFWVGLEFENTITEINRDIELQHTKMAALRRGILSLTIRTTLPRLMYYRNTSVHTWNNIRLYSTGYGETSECEN